MNVKLLIASLIAAGREVIEPQFKDRTLGAATPWKKYRPSERQNHSKGESKARRKMAARSRRINRGK